MYALALIPVYRNRRAPMCRQDPIRAAPVPDAVHSTPAPVRNGPEGSGEKSSRVLGKALLKTALVLVAIALFCGALFVVFVLVLLASAGPPLAVPIY